MTWNLNVLIRKKGCSRWNTWRKVCRGSNFDVIQQRWNETVLGVLRLVFQLCTLPHFFRPPAILSSCEIREPRFGVRLSIWSRSASFAVDSLRRLSKRLPLVESRPETRRRPPLSGRKISLCHRLSRLPHLRQTSRESRPSYQVGWNKLSCTIIQADYMGKLTEGPTDRNIEL